MVDEDRSIELVFFAGSPNRFFEEENQRGCGLGDGWRGRHLDAIAGVSFSPLFMFLNV